MSCCSTERAGRVCSKVGRAAPQPVTIPLPDIFAESEGGLLGMVADPDATNNRRFYTCQAIRSGGPDVGRPGSRWKLTDATATRVSHGAPVVSGLPLSSGRHSGCRLRFGPDGMLYIGTGDAAVGTNPQNRQSLGGKVLRVAPNGSIPPDNPFVGEGGNARYVWSYGHRNVQGLAFRPGPPSCGALSRAPAGTTR